MSRPTATYRLQFRGAMTFDAATDLTGYLADLGVSHLYASPLFAAAPGSTHGYDGIDFGRLEPTLGGEPGFARLSDALSDAGLELLIDFVPNHMAASTENAWWRSVLEWGAASPHVRVFDIDWSAPRLLLPILGKPYEMAMEDGELGLEFDAEAGEILFTCPGHRLPVCPAVYPEVLEATGDDSLTALGAAFANATPRTAPALKGRLRDSVGVPEQRATLDRAVAVRADDPKALHALHESQPWRLAHWRLGREALTYRRFFEITDLVCLRVEDSDVFDAVHAKLFALIAAGRVHGTRIDHVDGLADPKEYLAWFQARVAGAKPHYLLVEKVLEGDETLRPDWPVAGTTGYEFAAALADLFTDPDGEADLTAVYVAVTGDREPFTDQARAAKRSTLTHNLEAELSWLVRRAEAIAGADGRPPAFSADALRCAIVEFVTALPVYRTYVDGPDTLHPADKELVAGARAAAKNSRADVNPAAVDFIADLAQGAAGAKARAFADRLQQITGPVMAKALEDTLFYRFNRLIALNEVGGDPLRFGAPVADFHAAMTERQQTQPGGLSATTTHDTKRGEDARARLYAIGEMPAAWKAAVARWTSMVPNHDVVPADQWLFYQALAGAWPAGLAPEDAAGLVALRDRMMGYMQKAAREAKLRTSWTDPDMGYEAALADFVATLLSLDSGAAFLADFAATCRPLWLAGAVTGLAQQAIKLFAPGVPDIYQGSELWDVSLVDPDNRTPVDFDDRRALLASLDHATPETLLAAWQSGAPKLALTVAGLGARGGDPALFARGTYEPLAVFGPHARRAVAFARRLETSSAVAVVPRFVLSRLDGNGVPHVSPESWGDTSLVLPGNAGVLRDIITGETYAPSSPIPLARLLRRFPVALLIS